MKMTIAEIRDHLAELPDESLDIFGNPINYGPVEDLPKNVFCIFSPLTHDELMRMS